MRRAPAQSAAFECVTLALKNLTSDATSLDETYLYASETRRDSEVSVSVEK